MDKKLKKALKEVYRPPAPVRKESFFQQLEAEKKMPSAGLLLFFQQHMQTIQRTAAAFCAIAFFGIGFGVYQSYTDGKNSLVVTDPLITQDSSEIQAAATTVTTDLSDHALQSAQNTGVSFAASTETQSVTAAVSTELSHNKPDRAAKVTDVPAISNDDTERITQTPVQTTVVTAVAMKNGTTKTTAPKSTAAPQKTTASALQTTKAAETTMQQNQIQTTTKIAFSPEPEPILPKDDTITPSVRYTITEHLINAFEITNSIGSDVDVTLLHSLSDLAAVSDCIVSGTIQDVIYTSLNGKPWTQLDIMVEETFPAGDSLSSDYCYGDRISIYLYGGYMPLEEFIAQNHYAALFQDMTQEEIAETTYFHAGNNTVQPEIGQSMLFFLKKAEGCVPDGAYMRCIESDFAQFQKKDGWYVCPNPKQTIQFQEQDL